MPAAVVSIGLKRRGFWSLLEIARPGGQPVPYGILLAGDGTADWAMRLRRPDRFDELDETDAEVLCELGPDLERKAHETGGTDLIASFADSLSGFLRISDREAIAYSNAQQAVDRLFDEHVDSDIRKYVTHLPLYDLRAAATKFGEGMNVQEQSWVRAPENVRLTEDMFAAHVIGRSMEPMIPDGAWCVFRAQVTGSRKGRFLLIEKFDETDFAARYTVKRYARSGKLAESADREAPIRLEPLNPEFEAFDLTSDRFRVVAEFVQVLYA